MILRGRELTLLCEVQVFKLFTIIFNRMRLFIIVSINKYFGKYLFFDHFVFIPIIGIFQVTLLVRDHLFDGHLYLQSGFSITS